jgi:uncharacterized membrane protein YgcG
MGLNYRQQRSLAESVDSVLDPQTNQAQLDEGYGSIREKASTRVAFQIKTAGDSNMDLPDDVIDYVVNNIALSEKAMSITEAYNEALKQLNEFMHGSSRPGKGGGFGGGGGGGGGPFGGGGGGRPEVDPDISPGAVDPIRKFKREPGFINDLKRLVKRGWQGLLDFGEDFLDFLLRTGRSIDDWLNENIIDPILNQFFQDQMQDPEKRETLRIVLKIALSYLLRKWIGGSGGGGSGGGGGGPGQGGPGSGGPLGGGGGGGAGGPFGGFGGGPGFPG